MDFQDSLSHFTKALSSEEVSHALIGGLALAAYGVIRATVDIDFLVDGSSKGLVKKVLEEKGYKVVHESEEVLQLSGPGQVDILWANRDATQVMLKNARIISGFPVPVVEAEDLIGLKIQAYKNDSSREFQDKADIQSLIKTVGDLNFEKIKNYADLFDEWAFIESLRGAK